MPDPIVPDPDEWPWRDELVAAIFDTSRRADGRAPISIHTASYTLDLSDEGLVVEMNLATANNLTVPPEATIPFPVGATVYIRQTGTGLTTIQQGAGVVIHAYGRSTSFPLAGQWAEAMLSKRASDDWSLSGTLA